MTLADALQLRKGDFILHKAGIVYGDTGEPAMRPIRVTEVWVNAKRDIVLVRLASVDAKAWLDATAYELPPEGMVWNRGDNEWITTADYLTRAGVA